MSTKICKDCGKDKDKSDFYPRDIRCKDCKKLYQKVLLQNNRDENKILKDKIDEIRDINDKLIKSNLEKDEKIKRLIKEIDKLKIDQKK